MKVTMSLSTESISRAIFKLQMFNEYLQEDLAKAVDILASEGEEIARSAYGNFNIDTSHRTEGLTAEITAAGDSDELLVAEFGAGQATMPVMFENQPYAPVYEGAYSELVGSQEYYKYGSWHFAGKYFTEVPARHGLLNAKQYIIENCMEVLEGVFG